MIRGTTVNEILGVAKLPFVQKTSVVVRELDRECNQPSLWEALFVEPNIEIVRDYLVRHRPLGPIVEIESNIECLSTILEQVHVSSSHSEVLNKVARISTLISDWDEEFKAPSTQTITNALKTATLFPRKFPIPRICISADGEITFELVKGKKRAVIDINDESDFSYAYFHESEFVPGKEIGKITSEKLPNDLIEYFSS